MTKILLLAASLTSALSADVIYRNITEPTESGAAVQNENVKVLEASAFTPGANASLTSASARLFNLKSSDATVNFALYSSDSANGGLPGSSIAELGSITLGSLQEGVFTVSPSSPVPLSANVRYWLVLAPGTENMAVDWESGGDQHAAAYNNVTIQTGWVADDTVDTEQFEITGAISSAPGAVAPEPSSEWLLAAGFGIACLLKRRYT